MYGGGGFSNSWANSAPGMFGTKGWGWSDDFDGYVNQYNGAFMSAADFSSTFLSGSTSFIEFFDLISAEINGNDFNLSLDLGNGLLWVVGNNTLTAQKSAFGAYNDLNYLEFGEAAVLRSEFGNSGVDWWSITGMAADAVLVGVDLFLGGPTGEAAAMIGARKAAWNAMKATKNMKALTRGRFPKFARKYSAHAKEWSQWGSISKDAFYNRAIRLADSPIGNNTVGFTSRAGTVFRYNTSTGEFLTINPAGHIETFFRPKRGYDYYLKQIRKYGR